MQCRTAGNDLPWSGLCNVVTVVATLTHIYIYHKNVNYLLGIAGISQEISRVVSLGLLDRILVTSLDTADTKA